MSGPAGTYAAILREVQSLIARHRVGNDAAVTGYMVARAAFLEVRAARGGQHAGELAYKIADEMTTSGPEAVG